MDGGRDRESDNVIPHGSPHVPHDCFETRDRTIKILRWSFLLSGSSRTKLPQCLQWLSSSLASVSQAGGWWNLFRGDCGTCYRRSSLWGWRLHPPLCGDGQPALPLLHLHLLRPPRHPWGAHLGGRRVSQDESQAGVVAGVDVDEQECSEAEYPECYYEAGNPDRSVQSRIGCLQV